MSVISSLRSITMMALWKEGIGVVVVVVFACLWIWRRLRGNQSMETAVLPSSGTDSTGTDVPDYSKNYDVFLSHRGPDTKEDFVSFLDEGLKRVGIQPFFDINDIGRGEDSWECIEGVLKRTPIAVVIFSKGFAGSEWCLKELHVILKTPDITMLPIFYKVQASDLCNPEKVGFKRMKSENFGNRVIEEWRADLEKASRIDGWEYQEGNKRMAAGMVKEVVEKVFELANKPLPLYVAEHPIGVQRRAEDIIRELGDKKEVRMLGLVGMGGIGKSTLARELYNRLSKRYAASCYVEEVKEKDKFEGVVSIQKRVLKDLCMNESLHIEDQSKGKTILEDRLQKMQFLLVLDNVKDEDMMKYIVTHKMLMGGSMCIVTSRDMDVFKTFSSDHQDEIYIREVQKLSGEDSEQLFRAHAFGRDEKERPESPNTEGFGELIRDISKACGGVPLVLKIFGCLLKGNHDREAWEEAKERLNCGEIMSDKSIFECLRISYDALEEEQKDMFVEIACALLGQPKDLAVRVWKSRGWRPVLGVSSLVGKALVCIDDQGCFSMHDHLRDMGRKIEMEKEAGKRKHLWMPEALSLLKGVKQFPRLQSLIISNTSNQKLYGSGIELGHMKELRVLLCNGTINVASVPANLLWLQIRKRYVDKEASFATENEQQYPEIFSIVPENNELVVLDFRGSYHNFEGVNRMKCFKYLQVLQYRELSKSINTISEMKTLCILNLGKSDIESLPESFGELTNLEVLHLNNCEKLSVLPDSIGCLKKLKKLWLDGSGIGSLPESFGELTNLEVLDMNNCKKLSVLLDCFLGLKKLKKLSLNGSGIGSLLESFGELTDLEVLGMSNCEKLSVLPDSFVGLRKLNKLWLNGSCIRSLPESFGELTNLEVLRLSNCKNLSVLPKSFGGLKKLKELLIGSRIGSLTESFGELTNLEVLRLSNCEKLYVLPDSFGGLQKLWRLLLNGSGIRSLPESFGELTNLEVLHLSNCKKLSMLTDSFGDLQKLKKLWLNGSGIGSLPELFGELTNLEVLDMSNCEKLNVLPDSFGGLKRLWKLLLNGSGIGSLPESFGELTNLEVLDMNNCEKLSVLPDSFGGLKKLKRFWLNGSGIGSFPGSFGELTNLEVLHLNNCEKLNVLPDSFGGLNMLDELRLNGSGIGSLPESFGELTKLQVLDMYNCKKLDMIPDSFVGLKKLWKLSLNYSGIGSLPELFGELTNLKVLDMTNCKKLSVFPDSFGRLKKLKVLLNGSSIGSLPESFGELTNLEVLHSSKCEKLSVLPDSFVCLKKLKKLWLDGSGIGSLPESFGELTNLKVLHLSNCEKLSVLPDSIGCLKKLKKLWLNDSGIGSLPESFGELTNLEVLHLSNCEKLSVLPDSFGGLKRLKSLWLNGSGIRSLPELFRELTNLDLLGQL